MEEDNKNDKRIIDKSKMKTIKFITDSIEKIDKLDEEHKKRQETDVIEPINKVKDLKELKKWKNSYEKQIKAEKSYLRQKYSMEKKAQKKLDALLRPKKKLEKKIEKLDKDIKKAEEKRDSIAEQIEELQDKIRGAKSIDEKDEYVEKLQLLKASLIKTEDKYAKLLDQRAVARVKLAEEKAKLYNILQGKIAQKYVVENDEDVIEVSPRSAPKRDVSAPINGQKFVDGVAEPANLVEESQEEEAQDVQVVEEVAEPAKPVKKSQAEEAQDVEVAEPAKPVEKSQAEEAQDVDVAEPVKPVEKSQAEEAQDVEVAEPVKPIEESQEEAQDVEFVEEVNEPTKPIERPKVEKKQKYETLTEEDKAELVRIVEGDPLRVNVVPKQQIEDEDKIITSRRPKPYHVDYDVVKETDPDLEDEIIKEQKAAKKVENKKKMTSLIKRFGKNMARFASFVGRNARKIWSKMGLGINNALSSANKGMINAANSVVEKGQKNEVTFEQKRKQFTKQYEATLSPEEQEQAYQRARQAELEKFEEENEFDDAGNIL